MMLRRLLQKEQIMMQTLPQLRQVVEAHQYVSNQHPTTLQGMGRARI